MPLAKDSATAAACGRAIATEGVVTKYYTGLSRHRRTQKKQGWGKGHMVRGRRKSWYLTSSNEKDSKNVKNYAKTRFFTAGLGHLLAASAVARTANNKMSHSSSSSSSSRIKTLLLFRPYTGKTHQLRVAAKSVGLPLAGDPIYKDNLKVSSSSDTTTTSRTYLHATGLHISASAFRTDGNDNDEAVCAGFQQVLQTLVEKHIFATVPNCWKWPGMRTTNAQSACQR